MQDHSGEGGNSSIDILISRGIGAATMLMLLCLCGCINPCDDEIQGEAVSPNGKIAATVYVRGCGATTPFVTHLSLRQAYRSFRGGDRDSIVFSRRNRGGVSLRWAGSERLAVTCSVPALSENLYNQKPKWRSVEIVYENCGTMR